MVFDISNVLIILFICDILTESKINISDEEFEQLMYDLSFDEKDRFNKYIEECKSYFENILKGVIEEDIQV